MSPENEYTEEQLEEINKNINKKKDEALCNLFIEKFDSQINSKMLEERHAGCYVLICCSNKLAILLKVFLLGELAIVPDSSLNSIYIDLTTHIESVLKNNPFIKESDCYEKLKELYGNLPPALSDNTIRFTDWEKVLESGCMLQAIISKYFGSWSIYTMSNDDPFNELLKNAGVIADNHLEIRKKNTNKEIVSQINEENLFFKDINSLFKKDTFEDKRKGEAAKVVVTNFPDLKFDELQYLENLKYFKEPSKIEVINQLDVKGLEEKVILQKPKKEIVLSKFPDGLKWAETTLTFLNEQEVHINAKGKVIQTDFEQMGFKDERKKAPNVQWSFLVLLAKKDGELSWDNNKSIPIKEINKFKKRKELLSSSLSHYFQITEDPFFDYKEVKGYKIKMTLVYRS